MRWIPKLISMTRPSGAKITSQISGVLAIRS